MGSAFHQLCPRYSGTLTPAAPTAIRLRDTVTFLCSLLQNIYVIANLFITNSYLLEMIRKIIFINYFSEFIHKFAIKFRFRKTL